MTEQMEPSKQEKGPPEIESLDEIDAMQAVLIGKRDRLVVFNRTGQVIGVLNA